MDFYPPLVRHLVAPAWAWKDKSQHYRYLKEFEKTQYWKPEQIRTLQWKLLKNIIAYAYEETLFYRERFNQLGIKPDDIRSFEDYRQVPFLTKKEIQDRGKELLARDFPQEDLVRNTTGGSTGSPLVFYHDQERMDSRRASTLRHNRWAGWEIGDKVGILWGARQDFSPLQNFKSRFRNLLLERELVLDTSALDEQKLSEFARQLIGFKPKVLLAYANSMYLFARFVEANGIGEIRPKSIITSAEVLHPHERETIEKVFACPVFDRYGSRETSVIASECEHHTGLHVNAETLYVEIVKQGKAAPSGETGEVVITDLLNLAMPFLRYKIEDTAFWAEGACACGRGLPSLGKVTGRVTDFILTPEGKLVSGASLTIYLITNIAGLKQVQIIQDKREHLLFKLVKDGAFSDESRLKLNQRIKEILGNRFQLDFQFVSEIPREPSGKYRFSISNVIPEFFR